MVSVVAAGGGSDGQIAALGCEAGGIGFLQTQDFVSGEMGVCCSRRRENGEAGRMKGRSCGRRGGG